MTLSPGFKQRGGMKGINVASEGSSADRPRGALTGMMRIKLCLYNLSNRIKFHLCRSGVMLVLCITAEGFQNECFRISVIKKHIVISDFCLFLIFSCWIPPCLHVELHRSNINRANTKERNLCATSPTAAGGSAAAPRILLMVQSSTISA